MATKAEEWLNQLKLLGIIPAESIFSQRLTGTTEGQVHVITEADGIQPLYVMKWDDPVRTELTTRFLQVYPHLSLYPSLYYTDPTHQFVIYEYKSGSVYSTRGPKEDWLQTLITATINRYERVYSGIGWGWLDEVFVESWGDFLKERVSEAKLQIGSSLTEADHAFVEGLAADDSRNKQAQPYLLHGDCGVHNFLFEEKALTGIIDADPIIGPAWYDALFAFCSSPEELTLEVWHSLLAVLDPSLRGDDRAMLEELLLVLYCRVATCLEHHPGDLAVYQQAWSYWRSQYQL